MNNLKPTFGARLTTSENKQTRLEIGAVWQKNTKANKPYLNIKVTLSKNKIKELLTASEEEVNLTFVGFLNETKVEGDNRPTFRLFEEQRTK